MRVDVLESNGAKTWDSRHSLNSIPPEQLRTILLNKARDGNLQDYLDVASLFDSAKRYQDAIFIVEQIIKEMPEMEGEMRKEARQVSPRFRRSNVRRSGVASKSGPIQDREFTAEQF